MKPKLRRLVALELERRVKRLVKQNNLKIVAITGSVGKTTTKLAIANVLEQKFRVLVHPGNYNSEIGLPLSIFEIDVPETLTNPLRWLSIFRRIDQILSKPFPYDVLVLEMGADQPNDIQKFTRYITPDVGVVTAIAPVHIEGFGSIANIAFEKMALAKGSRAVLLNAEDKLVMQGAKNISQPIQTYGVATGETHFSQIKREDDLLLGGKLHLHNGDIKVKTKFVAKHSLAALAAAAAVGEELGLDDHQVKAGLEALKPPSGRMQVLKGLNNSLILDDTYNSSPRSAIAALEALADLPGRKIAILGSMNELGDYERDGHKEVGLAAKTVDLLITIGDNARKYLAAGAAEGDLPAEKIKNFTSPYEAGKFVAPLLKPGDVVLAKGSQNGVFAEEAIAFLLANPSDRNKLVRQSQDWLRRKHQQFDVE